VLVWLANNANPPTGRTGAPFDGHCNNCHNDGNPGGFDGTVDISGLPSTIEPNTTYPITLTMTPTAGTPIKGGFQLVVVNGNNANAGDLTPVNSQTGTEVFGGREYIEHRGGKLFSGGSASWNFNWKSPLNAAGNVINVYFIGNFTNNNNQNTGDYPVAFMQSFDFNAPPPVTATITDINHVSCFGGNNGSATVEAGGGVPPYTYLWSNGQTTATATNLAAGNYTVTVTGSGGSGSATATATITQPPVLGATATVAGIITCVQNSVTVTANPSGGTPPYSYEWSNGNSGNPTTYSQPGAHNVTVTDDNGCTKVATFNISSNTTPPNAVAGPPGSITCLQPTDTLNGTGSSSGPNFSYLWTASSGGNIVSGATTLTPIVNAAGTYTIKVTNSTNGCTATASTTVSSNISPPDVTATGGTLTCAVTSLVINANSNTPNVTYSWSGPGGFTSNLKNPTVNLPGNYVVTVTNPTNSCTNTAIAVVNQNITPPTAIATVSDTLTCDTPSVQLNISTDAPSPTFAWSGPDGFTSNLQNPTVSLPGNYIGTVTNNANGCTNSDTVAVIQNITPPGATASVSGPITCATPSVQLSGNSPSQPVTYAWSGPNGFASTLQNPTVNVPGNYALTVTWGANGCSSTATATVTQNTTSPVASIATPPNLNCNNATIQLNATASSQGANFAYLWTTANGHIVSGETTLTPIVDAAGTYNLLVTNTSNGCTATANTTVVQNPPVTATASATNVSCNGGANGSATATPGGGAGTFTYAWSNGGNTATISNLPAGTYTVTVTDVENCTATATATVAQPAVLLANASATGETANGANDGTATAAPSGGTPAYTYLWSNGGNTQTITNLAPGNYTVTVTDANACTSVETVTVNSFNCTISGSISSTNVTCNGANNGTATANVSGGEDPITYSWSNGASTQTISDLSPGTYSVSIVDGNDCPLSLIVQITEPPVLSANATATPESGQSANDGTATAQPTGGTLPYSYLWSNDSTTATITNLAPGSYSVTVTDANECTASQTVIVNSFNCNATANISAVNVSCPGANDGQATVTLNGGTLPFEYLWSNGDTTATISNLNTGTYSVTVIDADNCAVSQSVNIIVLDTIEPTISCPGNISNCGADVVNYPTPVISDNCSLAGIQPVLLSGLPSGAPFNDGVTIQVFQVTDASSNTATCSFSVTINPLPDILVDSTSNDINSEGVGSINVTAVGGTAPYVFIWRKNGVFFSNDEDLDSLNAGVYSLTIIDSKGCQTILAPITISNIVGMNEPGEAAYIRLWPNPAKISFRLEMSGLQPVAAQIFNAQGKLLQEINPTDLTGEISVEQLPSGLYYLKILTKDGRVMTAIWMKAD
jgi:uncharacterized protein (DUF2141 family)